ncbi:3-deoxy-D-manno-octulosonic-acid transferase [Bacteroidales bacterium Barb6]|nr:3-deoxy-D-manno-octulosonic-acid transferase [Bacteroidales bacterium Barb6]
MYTLIIHLYAWVVRLAALFHRKARAMRAGQRETLPLLRNRIDRTAKYIWFHASSLGEFEQGRPMMEKIKATHPEYKILLTFFSPSGYEVRKDYAGADIVCYLPFDTPRRVKAFLNLTNPAIAVFIKYEFWGNYLHELKKRGIPVYIVSAIFRREQLFFKWYGKSYRKILLCFNHLFVQDNLSKELLNKYGITNVTVTGDTRFDRVHDIYRQRKAIPAVEQFIASASGEKKHILIAGSSWPQDEELLINYFNNRPDLKLIIAPHEIDNGHLQHIESLLKRPSVRLSEADNIQYSAQDCLIADSFGLLSSIYRYGDIAYIGGGFGAGIHNTLEAAVYGIPVLFGPNYQKFKEAKDLIDCGAAFSILNEAELANRLNALLADTKLSATAGKAAARFVQEHIGTTDKVLAELSL